MRAASRTGLVIVVTASACGIATQGSAAQQSRDSTRTLVRGIVRDATTREALADASVRANVGSTTTSNEKGEFVVEVPAAGRVTLHVRRLGYDSLSTDVDLGVPERGVVVELHRVAQTLDTVAVATRPASWSAKVEGFEHRLARKNGGTFFTRDEIERRNPLVTSEVVRRAQGVRVIDSMGVRLFASARGNKLVDGPRGRKSVPCIMRVGIDGQIMEWGFAADQIAPTEIYGIEVYSGPATVPREYASQVADGFCGLVMIWTR